MWINKNGVLNFPKLFSREEVLKDKDEEGSQNPLFSPSHP